MTLILPRLRRDEALLEKSGGANIQLQRYWQRVVEAAEAQDASIQMMMAQIFAIIAPRARRTLTASGNAVATDYLLLVDATAGAVTVTLPAAADSDGAYIITKKIDASANAVTVDGNGAETIDGAANIALAAQYDAVTVFCDGSTWWII